MDASTRNQQVNLNVFVLLHRKDRWYMDQIAENRFVSVTTRYRPVATLFDEHQTVC